MLNTDPMKYYRILLFLFIPLIAIAGAFSQVKPDKIELISNGSLLNAFFYSCSGSKPAPVIILLHGWPGNADNPLGLAPKICAGGIHVLVFNFRGTWGSQGFHTLRNSAEDIAVAIRFLKAKENMARFGIDTSKIIVAGYSLGGGAAMTAGLHYPEVDKIISIAGADVSVFIRMLISDPDFRSNFEERTKKGVAEGGFAKISGNMTDYVDELISDIDYFDPVKHAETLKNKKILFIVGWDDLTGRMEDNALPLYRKLKGLGARQVSIVGFPDDHSFNGSRDEVAKAIVGWVKQMK